MNPRQRLFGSRKFWMTLSAGIISTGASIAPFLTLFFHWDTNVQAAFERACNGIAAATAGLGGVLVIMIGAEDSAEKVGLPPPAPPPKP